MKAHALFSAALCCCLLILACAAAQAQADLAAEVQGMYDRLLDPENPCYDDFAQLRPLASPQLVALMDREIACSQIGEYVCNIDGSVLTDAQEWEVHDLAVTQTLDQEDTAEVTATFLNFEEPTRMVFVFQRQEGQWLLTDLQRRDDDRAWSLVEILQQPLPY